MIIIYLDHRHLMFYSTYKHVTSQYIILFFFLMIRQPPRSPLSSSSAASDVYKRQLLTLCLGQGLRGFMVNYGISPRNAIAMFGTTNLPRTHARIAAWQTSKIGLVYHNAMNDIVLNCFILILSLIHISEPTRLLSISYAVFCLKKKKKKIL
eukprot:TRINITY_DN10543_c0_g1_i11.p1 TRINITY_DN10543_c0_g1~~TRINITY_DN10543_c0_g1_i11.p1  ORF type:complete len:152 (-),score=23.47 TRINITY_DN10543_c0_g1_i11:89-544(-)